MLPVHLDSVRSRSGAIDLGNRPAFPPDDLIERGHTLTARRSCMSDLAIFKEHSRFFAVGPGEFYDRGRATHTFELNDVRELEVAQRAFKFFTRGGRRL